MTEVFEMLMLVCFGLSWPISVLKAYKSCTSKGKSLWFELAIFIGYICGICSKLASGNINYVLGLYVINLIMVFTDVALYIRNRRHDIEEIADSEEKLAVS